MNYDIARNMVEAAVQEYGRGGDEFSASVFLGVVRQRFDLDRSMTLEWASGVLSTLEFLERVDIPGWSRDSQWRYLPGAIGNSWDNFGGEMKPLEGGFPT